MNKKPKQQTRREFLHAIGGIGGTATVYQAMISMGLLVPGDARAAINLERWKQNSQQSLTAPKPTIAVLGAGISGLCVAWELKKAGFPFFVIEARPRPG